MVRVNLISPSLLSDQHLIAEWRECLCLLGWVRNNLEFRDVPEKYSLGWVCVRFFSNKILYISKRLEAIRTEMIKRGFKPKAEIKLDGFTEWHLNDWEPGREDIELVKKQIVKRLEEKKDWYRYCGKYGMVDEITKSILF